MHRFIDSFCAMTREDLFVEGGGLPTFHYEEAVTSSPLYEK